MALSRLWLVLVVVILIAHCMGMVICVHMLLRSTLMILTVRVLVIFIAIIVRRLIDMVLGIIRLVFTPCVRLVVLPIVTAVAQLLIKELIRHLAWHRLSALHNISRVFLTKALLLHRTGILL